MVSEKAGFAAVWGQVFIPIGVRFPFCSGREVFVTAWSQVSVLQWEGGVCFRLGSGVY
ncbi:hypothetical protein LJC08_05515 [Methanimicrococcus sp. OttesenSCG-928-J09]|nr:hypothetical protein [Methanimicrococcus sp. OttesenSCG-928-J09]